MRIMHIVFYDSALSFKEKIEPILMKEEAKYNVILGIVNQLFKSQVDPAKLLMCTVEEKEETALILLRTYPHNLLIAGESVRKEQVTFAVRRLSEEGFKFPGVTGEKQVAEMFAEEWKKVTGMETYISMQQGIYELTKLNPIPLTKGHLRHAVHADHLLVSKWMEEFSQYTVESPTTEECRKMAEEYIEQKSLYVWVNGDKVVSMVKKARPTKNGMVVTLVYTPEEYRGKGFASSSVYTLTKQLLEEYSFCSLYTDLKNPTSNSIYKKIGYKRVCESVMIQFGINPKGELVV